MARRTTHRDSARHNIDFRLCDSLFDAHVATNRSPSSALLEVAFAQIAVDLLFCRRRELEQARLALRDLRPRLRQLPAVE